MDEVHSISVCKVFLEFRLESKLNKNNFLVVGVGGEGGGVGCVKIPKSAQIFTASILCALRTIETPR